MPSDVWETGKPSKSYTPRMGKTPTSRSRPTEMFEVAASPKEKEKYEKEFKDLQQEAADRGAKLSAQDYVNISKGGRTEKEILLKKQEDRKELLSKPEKIKKTGIIEGFKESWSKTGGFMGLPMLFIKAMLGKDPTAKQLNDPNFLASIYDKFKNDKGRVDQFAEDYKDIIYKDLGKTGGPGGDGRNLSNKERLLEDLKGALEKSKSSGIFQGSTAQKNIEPWNYYNIDKYREFEQKNAKGLFGKYVEGKLFNPLSSRFANTMGNLEEIAKIPLDSIPYDEAGQKFRRQVIEARGIVDQKTRYTGLSGTELGGGGGGAGIPSIPDSGIIEPLPGAGDDPTFKPGVNPDNPWGIPAQYAGFYDSPFNTPNQPLTTPVVTPVTLPSGETINFGNPYIADQFQQYMASQTQTPATGVASLAPTSIDYASMAPQFGSQYPSYVNQGVASPQLGDWYQNLNRYT